MKMRIGIRREDKNLWERRTPLIPSHVGELIRNHSLEILVQPSSIRIFKDLDYVHEGAEIEEGLSSCSIVFAIKEIPSHFFRRRKVYIFFSHTIKGQPKNMPMLKRMVEQGCTLIDYERIVDEKGRRLLFFGRQAGQAGMIDTLWALGKRLNHLGIRSPFVSLRQAYRYQSLVEAREDVEKIGREIFRKGLDPELVPLICGFAGYGHVSQGAQEILDLLPVEEFAPEELEEFIRDRNFASGRVYKTVFKEEHLVIPCSAGRRFKLQDYYAHPEHYRPVFESYLPHLTLLVNCIFWTPRYPRLVTKAFLSSLWEREKSPRLKVIGDISCDIKGAVECTLRCTSPAAPVFVYDPLEEKEMEGYEGRGVVVMAIDNLPAEISLESSVFFSEALKPFVPQIARADFSKRFDDCHLPPAVKKAVILYRGEFTPGYEYMAEFIL